MEVFPQLILQLLLIMCNAVFACAEIAIISMNDTKLAAMAAKGDKRAVRLARLTSSPAKFLATIQVAITLSGFMGSAFAADNFSAPLVALVMKTGIDVKYENTISSVAVIVITLILSYFTLVFGELVPKRFAMKKAESLALGMSAFINFISKLFAPIVWFLSVSTNGVLRLIGIDPNQHEETATEEEIRMMVDAGSEKGTIDKEEKELIQNVFEFDDLTAGEIATHRTDVALLWLDESPEEWENTIHESRHTLFPVCDETVDKIVGVLNAKDFFANRDCPRDEIIKSSVKKPYLVPETVYCDVLFKNMKSKREYFAIVIDEYGGMSGVVTITDILETLVGDFDEDTLAETGGEPDIKDNGDGTWTISGNASVDDVEEALDLSLDCEDCDTFGGYCLGELGAIPADGSTDRVKNDILLIDIVSVAEHRIDKTIVQKLAKPEQSEDEEK